MTFIPEGILTLNSLLADATEQMHLLLRFDTLGAAALTSQNYVIKNVVVVELYPTAIRNTAYAFTGLAATIGTMLASQIFLLVSGKPKNKSFT